MLIQRWTIQWAAEVNCSFQDGIETPGWLRLARSGNFAQLSVILHSAELTICSNEINIVTDRYTTDTL